MKVVNTKINTWSIVSTMKEDQSKIDFFIKFHLKTDVSQIIIFLDDSPILENKYDDRVIFIKCDLTFWQNHNIEKPSLFTGRQKYNLDYAYHHLVKTDWVVHIDCDELLHSKTSIGSFLESIDSNIISVKVLPFERILSRINENAFTTKIHYFKKLQKHKETSYENIYNKEINQYLRRGFQSHVQGKSFVKLGINNITLGIHSPQVNGEYIKERLIIDEPIKLLHFFCFDYESWKNKLDRKVSHLAHMDTKNKFRINFLKFYKTIKEKEKEKGTKSLFRKLSVFNKNRRSELEAIQKLIAIDDINAIPSKTNQ